MKVFVFCVAFLLASAVNSSPVDVEETDVVNIEIVEPEPEQVFEQNEPAPDEIYNHESEVDEKSFVIDDELGVPYDGEEAAPVEENLDEGKLFQYEDEYEEMTLEQKERVIGIYIPLCAQYTDIRIPLHLSHLTNCNQFYKCYDGKGYLMDCPAAEHWSVQLDRCDYPPIAKCIPNGTHRYKVRKAKPMQATSGQVEQEEEMPAVGEFEIDPRCEGSDPFKPLHFKHVIDCTKFYKCYMGKAYVIKCPKGQHWAQHLNRCEHPSLARCTLTRPALIKPAQAADDEEIDDDEPVYDVDFMIIDARCEHPVEGIYHSTEFAHPTNCAAFYICHGVRAYKYNCPAGLHFNAKTEQCDYPHKVRCTAGAALVPAQAFDDDEPHVHTIVDDVDYMVEDARCAPDEDDIYHPIQFGHPTNCNMFYKCFMHLAFKVQCPHGLYFNEKDQMCDYPWYTTCQASASFVQASFQQPAQVTVGHVPDCPKDTTINFPSEDSLINYFSCRNGLAYYMQCDHQEMFNSQTGKCERPNFSPEVMQKIPEFLIEHPEYISQLPDLLNQYPGMNSGLPGNYQGYPSHQGYPSYPGMNQGYPNHPVDPNFQMPTNGNKYPGYPMNPMDPSFQMPVYPMHPNSPPKPMQPLAPHAPIEPQPEERPQIPQINPNFPNWLPVPNQPQVPSRPVERPQTNPDFPSWMPVPNQNVRIPEVLPSPVKPQDKQDFDYAIGKTSDRCPSLDEPTKPTHISHESECGKFYKCFNGRVFLMNCPSGQEWSDSLQRCDYHQFALCDPIELIKRKIQN